MSKPWLAPFAWLYAAVLTVRHKMFDWGFLRSREYDIPVVCVGNLTVGGTGKTPVTETLIGELRSQFHIAVLSRGYKRKTKGYREATVKSSFLEVGDEPKQIKRKFPEIVVAVCEKRTEGIERIRRDHPEVDLIILDDGFQHRYVEPWVNILLVDYTRPVYKDHLLPWGTLRDTVSQLHRAHYVLVTKCPPGMNPLERRIVTKSLGLYPYQKLFFTTMEMGNPNPLFPEVAATKITAGTPVIAMCGIGNPDAFVDSLQGRYDVVGTLIYPDHHPYRRRDLADIQRALEDNTPESVIVMTEKDAVKLAGSKKIPPEVGGRLYYVPLKIKFNEDSAREFFTNLKQDVRSNPKHSFLNPQQG